MKKDLGGRARGSKIKRSWMKGLIDVDDDNKEQYVHKYVLLIVTFSKFFASLPGTPYHCLQAPMWL